MGKRKKKKNSFLFLKSGKNKTQKKKIIWFDESRFTLFHWLAHQALALGKYNKNTGYYTALLFL